MLQSYIIHRDKFKNIYIIFKKIDFYIFIIKIYLFRFLYIFVIKQFENRTQYGINQFFYREPPLPIGSPAFKIKIKINKLSLLLNIFVILML